MTYFNLGPSPEFSSFNNPLPGVNRVRAYRMDTEVYEVGQVVSPTKRAHISSGNYMYDFGNRIGFFVTPFIDLTVWMHVLEKTPYRFIYAVEFDFKDMMYCSLPVGDGCIEQGFVTGSVTIIDRIEYTKFVHYDEMGYDCHACRYDEVLEGLEEYLYWVTMEAPYVELCSKCFGINHSLFEVDNDHLCVKCWREANNIA
jgi:hypothetical protein